MREDDVPKAARWLVLPISSSAHHWICASDAVLPSRVRMVSAAHCAHALVADGVGIAAAAAAHRRSEQAERQKTVRLFAREMHADGAANFGADQMTARDPEGVEKPADVGGEFAGAPAIFGRLGEAPKPGMSIRTTRYLPARCGTQQVHAREDSELPCTMTTASGIVQGGPNQSSS